MIKFKKLDFQPVKRNLNERDDDADGEESDDEMMFANEKNRKEMRYQQSRFQPQANRRFNKYNNKHDDEMENDSDSDDGERASSEQAKSSYYQARRFK